MPKLPGRSVWLELSHDDYLRLSAESRRTGQSRQAIIRSWVLPRLEELPPAEFQPAEDDD